MINQIDNEIFLGRLINLIQEEIDEAAEEGINLDGWQVAKLIKDLLTALYPEMED